MRGGESYIAQSHNKLKKEYMKSYDKGKLSKHFLFFK